MAQNYISHGEVITLTAEREHQSGSPYRLHGFNGVALISVKKDDLLSFKISGVFEFELDGVDIGALILIRNGVLHPAQPSWSDEFKIFGRAVTGTDSNVKFHCLILQSI